MSRAEPPPAGLSPMGDMLVCLPWGTSGVANRSHLARSPLNRVITRLYHPVTVAAVQAEATRLGATGSADR